MGSRVSQLFGGSQKLQEFAPPPVEVNKQEIAIAKKIEAEKINIHLTSNAQAFRNKQLKYEAKINNLKLKAKEHLQSGNSRDAKKVLGEVARMQKQLERVEVRRKLIQSQQEGVQTYSLDREVIDALEVAHELTKQDLSGKLEEHIIGVKQNKVLQDQINENMKQLVENSEDEQQADDLMKQLERDIERGNKTRIPSRNVAVDVKGSTLNKNIIKQGNQVQKMFAQL